jgi:beta-lactamase regulating signal transducer with metallopeptidase domain
VALQLLIGSGTEPSTAARCVAVLMTYFIHVALWTVAATWVAGRRGVSPAARHALWMMALLGPVLTALCPIAITSKVAGAHVALARSPYVVAMLSSELGSPRAAATQLWAALAAAWLTAALLGALHFAGSLAWLWHSLRDRRAVTDARLLARLAVMRDRIRLGVVRLSESPRVFGPLVLGRSEICIPYGKLDGLTDAEVDGVLAHELAHLERGDGFWFPLVGLVQAVLWTHPLNHLLAARIRHSAEQACDDRAVALTGDPLGLARALTAVAASTPFARRSVVVPTMARSAKTLVQRVARLVNGASANPNSRRSAAIAIIALAAIGVATASLDVRVARAVTQAQRAEPRALQTTTVADADVVNHELDELLQREQQLETELTVALTVPGASQERTQASVRVLELQQALRHVRALEASTEDRFVDAWLKAQKLTSR